MANKVQIQVELKGAQQVNKQLDSIEKNSVDLSEGFKGVGESFKSVGDVVKAQGGLMGDAFGTLGESVGAITDSVGSFKGAMELAGQTGGKAWLAMLGPIAAVVSGISLAIEAYREFSGANKAAEDAAENMAAAASDTASRLEAMVEAGVNLGTEALQEFITVNERSRLAVEETIKMNEKRTLSDQKVKAATQAVKDAQESLFFTDMRVAMARKDLQLATNEYNDALKKQVETSKEANRLNKEAFELQELLIKSSQEFLDIYIQERERSDDLTLRITNTTNIRGKEKKIIEDTLAKKKQLIDEEVRYKDAIRTLEAQLKKGVLSQDLFDASTKQLKTNLRDTAKQIKETNDILEPYVKSLEATKEAQDGLKALGKEAFSKQNAMNIEDLNYQLQILNTRFQDLRDVTTNEGFKFFKDFEEQIYSLAGEMPNAVDRMIYSVKTLTELKPNKYFDFDINKGLVEDWSNYVVKITDDAEKTLLYMYEVANNQLESIADKRTELELYLSLDSINLEQDRLSKILEIRKEEIKGMEVSNKRKKELIRRAEEDYAYSLKKAEERTYDSVEKQIDTVSRYYVEQVKSRNEEEILEAASAYSLESLKIKTLRDKFVAEQEYRKDLQKLTAESNVQLLKDDIQRYKIESDNEKSLYSQKVMALKTYQNSLFYIRDNFARRLNQQQTDQLHFDILASSNRVKEMEAMEESYHEQVETQKYILNTKLRDASYEQLVQEKKFQDIFTQLVLSEEQIRSNTYLEFSNKQRELVNQEHQKKIDLIDKQLKEISSKRLAAEEQLNTALLEVESPQQDQEYSDLRYSMEIEINMYKHLEEEKLKIKKEAMAKIENNDNEFRARSSQLDREHYQAVGSLIKDFSSTSSQALIDAGVAAAFAGESISDALRTTLRGLAQEATARALFEGAAALGSLAIGDARGAALHGKSALAFGIAAAGMGALTAAVGVPGGGSSGGGGTTSPTGLSQTSEAPQREAAKAEAMVFNINFGNAVIYDTRAAAERAMAERVMELGVRARRGYNPPRPRI